MGHTFHILDVFTKEPFSGNQLCVVLDADDLEVDQMQKITCEFGFSETVFLQKSENPIAAARLRIFTPAQEIPFAGHPTIGVAALLATLKNDGKPPQSDMLLVLDEGIGIVRAGISMQPGAVPFVEFDAPQLPLQFDDLPELNEVADALKISIVDIGFENHRLLSAQAGIKYIFVPLKNKTIVGQAQIDGALWDQAFDRFGRVGVFVYCRETVNSDIGFHARMFAPALGVMEDPATGSAAIAFAQVVNNFEGGARQHYKTMIAQGYEMARPSQILLEVEFDAEKLKAVRIGGHVVHVATGQLS